jgi:hypothetical protein
MPEYPNNLTGIQAQLAQERLPVGWPWKFFTAMLVIFLAVLLSYLGLAFGYQPMLNNQLSSLQGQVRDLSNQIAANPNQKNVVGFYSQVVNIQKLLKNHVNATYIFPLLASSTSPQVSYTSAKISVPQSEVDLSGVAASYAVLASQLQAYQSNPQIKGVVLGSSQASGNAVTFSVKLMLDPNIFSYASATSSTSTPNFINTTTTTP